MRMNLLKSMAAMVALFGFGTMGVAAQTETTNANVKMTYISGSDENVDVSYGEIPYDQPAYAGYNKISGGTVALANKAWGVNNIAYLRVDASSTPGVIQKATLKADFQQIAARGMAYGVGYNDSEWSADMTWNTADRSITLMGGTQSTAKATDDVALEFDITDAMKFDKGYIATILVYNTAAGAGYIKNPIVEVEYEPYEATTTIFDFEDGNKVFTDDSRITSAIEPDATLNSNVLGWTCAGNAQNGYSFSHFDFTSLLDKPALVSVEFDYYNTKGGRAILNIGDALVRGTTGGSEKVTYNKTGVIFQIGSDKNNAFINGNNVGQDDVVIETPLLDPETGEEVGTLTTTNLGLCDKWLHVVVVINNDAKTVTWVVTDQEGELVHYGDGAFFADNANEATQIDLFGYINSSHCAMIDNLKITNYKSNAQFADYTIKYVDANGNELKESRTGNGQVGKFVTLIDSDKAAIVADSEAGIDGKMKYIYLSDDSETTPISAEGTIITVTFREAEIYAGVLNCMIDGQSGVDARLASFSGFKFFEGDTYKVYPSRGYSKDGVYYFTAATSYNGVTFTFPGSLNSRTIGGVVTYIGQLNYAAVDSVAYYSDFERLALPVEDEGNGTGLGQLKGTVNSWWSFSGGIFDRFSQGRGIRLDPGSYVWTEPIAEEGTYKVTIYGRNDVSAGDPNPYVLGLIREGSEDTELFTELTIPEWSSATTGSSVVENVAIPAGAKLIVVNTNEDTTSKVSLDDISLTKTGDFVEPVTVGINTIVENAQTVSNVIYNLNGQAVKVAHKGLYIQNGKKFIVK